MQIEALTPMADSLGRSYRPGQRYDMADDEAERLVRAGFARAVASEATVAVDFLKAHGGGLLVTKTTDQALIVAAKAARIPIKRVRGVPAEPDDGGNA